MALIELSVLKTYWQNVSDWVKGTDAVSAPKITVDASVLPTGASTEAKQDTLIAKDFATQTTLTAIKDTDGIKKITDAVTIVGNVADNVTVSGNPVLSAGLYSAIPVTRDDGDVVTLQTTANGALLTQTTIVGSLPNQTLIEQLTDADAVVNVLTFSANIEAIEIYHEEATWQTFIVNGLTIIVPAGGYRTPIAGVVGLTVTIPAISCIVGRLV